MSRTSSVLRSAALAVAVLFGARAFAALYVDSVDLQVAGNAKVRGTLRSAAERESFRLRLPMGAKVKAQAKRTGKGVLVPNLDLASGDTTLAEGTAKGRGSRLTSAPLAESGVVALRVFGNTVDDGDYLATLRVTLQRKWKGTGTSAGDGATLSFDFGAPAGSQARVRLTAARKSGFVPLLDALRAPGIEDVGLSGGSSGWIPLGDAGTGTVSFHDGGTTGGDWVCSVQLRLPRTKPANIDISAAAFGGRFTGTQQVYGSLVGPAGGAVDPVDLGTPLDGAKVTVPEGSLPFPVVLSIHLAEPIEVPPPDNVAGPTVQFEPSGTVFTPGMPAIVTIPYDKTQFGTPANEMTVYVRDDRTGDVMPVLPRTDYDLSVPGFVSFPVQHFSSYVAAGTRPRSAGNVAIVHLEGGPDGPAGVAACSETVTVGNLKYEPSPPPRWYVSNDNRGGQWRQVMPGSNPEVFENLGSLSGLAYPSVTGEQSVRVLYGSTTTPYATCNWKRARDGLAWVMPGYEQSLAKHATVAFALPLTEGAPTKLTLAGRWHLFFVGAAGVGFRNGQGVQDRVELTARGGRATVTIGIDGSWKLSNLVTKSSVTAFPDGAWAPLKGQSSAVTVNQLAPNPVVTFAPALGGTADETEQTVRFTFCGDGDVLVGYPAQNGAAAPVVVMVRESTNLKPTVLQGTTTQFSMTRETLDAGPTTAVQGFLWTRTIADATRTLPHGLALDQQYAVSFRLDENRNAVSYFPAAADASGTWTLSANGAYSDSTGLNGAVTPSGDLLVGIVADGARFGLTVGLPGEAFNYRP